MQLKLKDLQTSEEILVNEDGAVFGRAGGKVEIPIPDKTVSSKHAKIYARDKDWFLEDLGSSNGTKVNGQKLTQPLRLKAGIRFTLSRYSFEVIEVLTDFTAERTTIEPNPAKLPSSVEKSPHPGATQRRGTPPAGDELRVPKARDKAAEAVTDPNPSGPASLAHAPTAVDSGPAKRKRSGTDEGPAVPAEAAGPRKPFRHGTPGKPGTASLADEAPGGAQRGTGPAGAPPSTLDGDELFNEEGWDDEAQPPAVGAPAKRAATSGDEAKLTTADVGREKPSTAVAPPDAKGLVAGVVSASLYYLAALPLLLLNPLGTIKKGIAAPRFGKLGKMELFVYGVPAGLLAAALGGVGNLIWTVVTSGFGLGWLVGMLINAAIMVACSFVLGLIWHPFLAWGIKLLRGSSDEVGRSNYFVAFYGAVPLIYAANFLTLVFTLIPLRILGILPALVTVYASLVVVGVQYFWLKHFKVHRHVPTVVLVLGAVGALSTMLGFVSSLTAPSAASYSSASAGADADADAAAAQAEALAAAAHASTAGAAGPVATPAPANPDGTPASASAAPAAAPSTTAAPSAIAAPSATAATGATAAPAAPPATAPLASPVATPGSPGGSAAASVTPAAAPPAAGFGSAAAASASGGPSGFPEWKRRLAAINQAIDEDPTLLRRILHAKKLLTEIKKQTIKSQRRHAVKLGKNPSPEKQAEAQVAEKEAEAEAYETTVKLVDELYGAIERARGR